MSSPVQLWVYDLSRGMASQMSMPLMGKHIDGIWHTSVVVFDREIFFGQGISMVRPGTSHHGQPLKKLDMGMTAVDQDTFEEYLHGLRDLYKAERYHLLDFNCNTFTNDVVGFLTGGSIPAEITNLPADFLNTPFGQSLRPMIDSMFQGARRPEASQATSLLANAAAASSSSASPNATTSLGSVLTICTNLASFDSLLKANRCLVVMFTSETCPPCRVIKPTFEEIAASYSHAAKKMAAAMPAKKIAFALVEGSQMGSSAVMSKFQVTATPTFLFFKDGQQTHILKGANAAELKTQIELLVFDAYPPHPHMKLRMPNLSSMSKSSVNYTAKPNLSAAFNKLASLLDAASSTEASEAKRFYQTTVIARLQNDQANMTPNDLQQWNTANERILKCLAFSDLFPMLDLLRVAVLKPSWAAGLFPSLQSILNQAFGSIQADAPKSTLLTAIKLFTNAMTFLPCRTERSALTRLAIDGLLHSEGSVRIAAASLSFRLAQQEYSQRADHVIDEKDEADSEWEVEMLSAVLEALSQESSAEVVHRLIATVGLLIWYSPFQDTIDPLVDALEGYKHVSDKAKLLVDQPAQQLAKEVQGLVKSQA